MLSEKSQTKKKRSHFVWFHLHELSKIGESIETESRWVIARGWGGAGEHLPGVMDTESPLGEYISFGDEDNV